jgi:hypothetical protein
MNCRTWLLREMGKYQEAHASAHELIKSFFAMKEGQKPSRTNLAAARKLDESIKPLLTISDAAPMTMFGHSVKHARRLPANTPAPELAVAKLH